MNQTMVIATHNSGKLKEFQTLLDGIKIKAISLDGYHQEPPEETGSTFIENAIIKARAACELTGYPALADDSGLCIPELEYKPGVLSARYGNEQWSYSKKIQHLLDELKKNNIKQPNAFFYCAIVSMKSANDPTPILATGSWHGKIAPKPRGEQGFGYDPIFLIPSENCTAAELEHTVKARRSHRAKAFKTWLEHYSAKPYHLL